MSCSSCGKTRTVMRPHYEGPQYMGVESAVPPSGFTDKRTGKSIGAREPLVMNKPNGGWVVSFTVNGVPVAVAGCSASECIAKERLIIAQNGMEEQWNEEEAWRQANLQWLEKTDPKYHRVELVDVLRSPIEKEERVSGDGRHYDPSDWGHIAWKWLGLLLAKDRYDQAQFLSAFRQVIDLLNPTVNPSLGCAECHGEAMRRLVALQKSPPKTISEARRFLWEFHNDVNLRIGKDVLPIEQAEIANFWR